MDDPSIVDLLTGIQEGESIDIGYDKNLDAIVFGASKEEYHRGPRYRMEVRMSKREIAMTPDETREIFVKCTLRTVLDKVRDKVRESRR